MAAGKSVGFQVCPHLDDSNTQMFLTLKNKNQLQDGILLMHSLLDFPGLVVASLGAQCMFE